MSQAKLLTQRGSVQVVREQLDQFEPPPSTATWRPVKHSELVDALHTELDRRGLHVTHEQYAVQRQGEQ